MEVFLFDCALILLLWLSVLLSSLLGKDMSDKNMPDGGGKDGVEGKVSPVSRWKDEYTEDLKDARWREKRERILRRDGHECVWCGAKERLQVHHKYYNKYPDGSRVKAWDYPDDALIVLCSDCHKMYHSKHEVESYYRKKGVHYEKV